MIMTKQKYRIVLFLASMFALSACGKRGSLVYPDMDVPQAPTAFDASSVGNGVKLTFMLPANSFTNNDPKSVSEILVYRQQIAASQSFCSVCNDAIPLHKTLYLDLLRGAEKRGNLIAFWDADIQPEHKYRYRVALRRRDGVNGIQTSAVTLSVLQPFAAPLLTVENTPTEVILHFSGERPTDKIFTGYNVYRRLKDSTTSFIPLLTEPVKENSYSDFTLKAGNKYVYGVRSLYRNEQGALSESLLSNEVEGELSKYE